MDPYLACLQHQLQEPPPPAQEHNDDNGGSAQPPCTMQNQLVQLSQMIEMVFQQDALTLKHAMSNLGDTEARCIS